ncbi:MAG: hypothetical protein SVY53_10755 [Chloroflexota bacterium]|nr:hypothetical protein [Chloroflexota bacterium]
MNDMVAQKFHEWTSGKDPVDARIAIYEGIREIPYGVIPDLVDPYTYSDILRYNRGSCTPKHFLLCEMYQQLGLNVLYVVYPFRWDGFDVEYPPGLKDMAEGLPTSHHLACKVEIEDGLILVDATVDSTLARLSMKTNKPWDGFSDTELPIEEFEDEEIFYPTEASLMQASFDDESLAFFRELNSWLEEFRLFMQGKEPTEQFTYRK